ncbi:MAG: carboxypeptidase-like regulatory domain-containing protein [Flavobacterium sp.]|nr:carboxypeptidase-like regulatory domain-containing protein [Candidatus Neoflavobacterium equi]
MFSKFYLLTILLTMCVSNVVAQHISGIVYDEFKKPLEGVMVYADNTTYGTTTDQNGKFTLELPKGLNNKIAFRYLGYHTHLEPINFELPYRVELIVKASDLQEVVVTKSKFTRAELLNAFRKEFLGTTPQGKKCVILNEDVLQLYFDTDTNTLVAQAETSIIILNNYLGYKIHFDLEKFETKFKKTTLNPDFIHSNTYYGSSLFEVLQEDPVYDKNRKKTFLKSANMLFLNLIHDQLGNSNFQFYRNGFILDPKMHFRTIAVETGYIIWLLDSKENIIPNSKDLKVNQRFEIAYKGTSDSFLIFKTNSIFVDHLGNYKPIDALIWGGALGKNRIGNLLPSDYKL